MENLVFKEKFIGFIDILGFKEMVRRAEDGVGLSLTEIREILSELVGQRHGSNPHPRGPRICPQSAFVRRDLDFRITQVSDCAVVSAEISPAGAINIVSHCWGAAMMLLAKGIMIRGYITRGKIYHNGNEFIGTGYHEAYQRESGVAVFKREADEKGTPFVEVDRTICDYIRDNTDDCVRKMFDRCIKRDGDIAAIFPFQRLSHSFSLSEWDGSPFDPAKQKDSNNNVRKIICELKQKVLEFVDNNNEGALRKVRHYIAALDEQLKACDETDSLIDALYKPFPARTYDSLFFRRRQ